MGDVSGCTCLEVFGEDPNCPVHSYEALENRILDLERLIDAQHGDVVSRTAKLLYDKDARIAELEAEKRFDGLAEAALAKAEGRATA